MPIYKVVTPAVKDEETGQRVQHVRFASAEGAAKKFRRELAEAHDFKLAQVEYAPIDLKGGKAGVIAYLNAFHAQAPADYEPVGYPKAEPAKKTPAKTSAKKPAKKK